MISFAISYVGYCLTGDIVSTSKREQMHHQEYSSLIEPGFMVIEPPYLYSSVFKSSSDQYSASIDSYLFTKAQLNELVNSPLIY